MKKQPQRTTKTRSTIINTFLELSNQKPIDKITVSEISSIANLNRSTFYQYFNDINHILEYIEDDLIFYIKDNVVNQIGKIRTEQLFIELFIKINIEKRNILKLLLSNQGFSIKLKEILIPLFANQMNLSLEDPQTIYKLDFYLSGIISILSRWVTSNNPMPPEEYALLMKQIVEGMRKSELFPNL